MSASTTLTVRLPETTKDQLAQLAEKTRRTSSFLAAEAIAAYVARELSIIDAIHAGMDDVRNGRTIPHDEVMQQMHDQIAASRKKR
jgi:predicted transcriptional regulator